MPVTPSRSRGVPDPGNRTRARRRWLFALIGVGIVGAALALAFAVNRETCTVVPRIPEERDLLCALEQRGPDACPSQGISREECLEILEEFQDKHGPG